MERRLQDFFAAERSDVRAPDDLWTNVSARLGPQAPAPWWQRLFGGMGMQGMGRVYAGAAAAVAVAVVGVVMYTTLIGTDGLSDDSQESMAASVAADQAPAPAMAAAAPAPPPTPAPLAESSAPAAESMTAAAAMADAMPAAAAGFTQNASAGIPQPTAVPFRYKVLGTLNGVDTLLFWVALPAGWSTQTGERIAGTWTGVISGPDVTLEFTYGVRIESGTLGETLRARATTEQRTWDEYVIGNLAYIVGPTEGQSGDLLMALQLREGTLRVEGKGLTSSQQEVALMVFRSIIG